MDTESGYDIMEFDRQRIHASNCKMNKKCSYKDINVQSLLRKKLDTIQTVNTGTATIPANQRQWRSCGSGVVDVVE
jgi:hypothetical protein